MTIWIFFGSNPWFNACFKNIMEITYSFLSCKFPWSFSTFSIFILSGKLVNDCEGYVNFQDIQCQLKISLITFFFIIFSEAWIKFRNILKPLKLICRHRLFHCPTIQIICIPIFKIWRFFFIIMFHVFVISFCIAMNRVT